MKILFITNEVNLKSGWGVLGYYSIHGAIRNGHEVTVLTSWKADNLTMEGGRFEKILLSQSDRRMKPYLMILDFLRIYRFSQQADLIHIIIEPYLPLAYYFKNKKIVFDLAGTYAVAPFLGGKKDLYLRSIRYVDRVLSISNYTAERFREACGYDVEVDVVTLGVESSRFIPDEQIQKEQSVLFVGHIKPRKGLIYLINALSEIADDFPEVKLNIVGPPGAGAYETMCMDRINKLEMADKVIFHGKINDDALLKWYQRSIINVLPSINADGHFEGFGLIHLEANACGIPSIGSSDCGNEDAIINGETGWLCPQRDVNVLAERLRYVLEIHGTKEYAKLSENCLKHAQSNDWETYYSKIESIYRSVPDL